MQLEENNNNYEIKEEMNIIEANSLNKFYFRGNEKIHALNDINFSIKQGEIVSIVGASGSGKTTLVNVIGCLDNPTSGTLTLNKQQIFKDGLKLNETEMTKIRRKFFGYVFQNFFLIPTLSVKENIMLPSVFQQQFKDNEKNLKTIMEMLGIKKRENHLPNELSGGEMQRVAIARALINNPSILIADEPTGNLDSNRSNEIKELLLKLNREREITIILVTHNPEFAKIGSKIIEIKDGIILK
jgi:putative ABC transport system ATP-binding protein